MNASHFVRRWLWALGVSVVAATLLVRAQSPTEPFQPEIGQQGKDVVWVPTAQVVVDKMLDMANVTPRDYVMDLGSGDGRTVIAAAKRGARAVGIEYNPDMVELSKRNAARDGVSDKATFSEADLFDTDFSQASVITMFLLPDINLKLRPTLLLLEPGTRIVSNTWGMGEWTPDEAATVQGDCASWCKALLWIVPARVDGVWQLGQSAVSLRQAFQMLAGSLRSAAGSVPVEGRLRGNQITFTAGNAQYSGRVNGSAMEGTVTSGGTTANWSATRSGP